MEIDGLAILVPQVEAISKRLGTMQVQPQAPVISCEYWGSQAGASVLFLM